MEVGSNFKMKFQHIKHISKNIPEEGFFILNEFKSQFKYLTLDDIIQADLLNENYFSTNEQKVEVQKKLDQLTSVAKMAGAYKGIDKKELYGPMLKNKIQSSDFQKLDYKSFLIKMQSYKTRWTDEGWTFLVDGFDEFHQIALDHLENEYADKRDYYFLDVSLVGKDKLFEVNWYDYFFTVVSTLEDSEKVLIMNFGAD
jgi:hypothetical protein